MAHSKCTTMVQCTGVSRRWRAGGRAGRVRRMRRLLIAVAVCACLWACGDEAPADGGAGGGAGVGGGAAQAGGGAGEGGGAGQADGGAGGGASADAGVDCPRLPGPADGVRYVVASHPFPADGGSRDNRYEVFRLSADGALTATGFEMQMGTLMAPDKPIVFTPDGKVGVVAQRTAASASSRWGRRASRRWCTRGWRATSTRTRW